MGQVLSNPIKGPPSGRDEPLSSTLAMADADLALSEVEILEFQKGQFLSTQAGGIEEFEDGPVSNAEGIVDVRHLKENLDGIQREVGREFDLRCPGGFEGQ